MGKRAKQRIGVTMQLVVGEDDDLIRWVKHIPSNPGRNQAIKDTLRAAIGLPIPTRQDVSADELEAMRSQVAYLQEWLTKVADDLPAYVHGEIDRKLSGVAIVANGQPPAAMVSSPDEIAPEELTERKAKLKKATW